jgi:uncharacterized protein (TIGR01777 family)
LGVHVVITGGTGSLGRPIVEALGAAGHAVVSITRDPAHASGEAVGWESLEAAVAAADAVVHLAGEPIAAGRWTAKRKERIRASRVESTRKVVDALGAADPRRRILVSASAVGYYGAHGDEVLDESAPAGSGFLADVCRAWEAEAERAESLNVRVVRLRLGVVLARHGGALARMVPAFRAFVGGPIGSGRQWMSWIHGDDVTGLVLAALTDDRWRGAVNATSPAPVRNADFAAALGATLARPAVFPTPAFALRLALGEMADMLLTGQRVVPAAANALAFHWRYPDVVGALRASVHR